MAHETPPWNSSTRATADGADAVEGRVVAQPCPALARRRVHVVNHPVRSKRRYAGANVAAQADRSSPKAMTVALGTVCWRV